MIRNLNLTCVRDSLRKQLCNSGGKGSDKQRYAGSAQATVTRESLKKSGREFKTSWNHIKKQAQLTKNLWDTVKTVLYEDIATNAYR